METRQNETLMCCQASFGIQYLSSSLPVLKYLFLDILHVNRKKTDMRIFFLFLSELVIVKKLRWPNAVQRKLTFEMKGNFTENPGWSPRILPYLVQFSTV